MWRAGYPGREGIFFSEAKGKLPTPAGKMPCGLRGTAPATPTGRGFFCAALRCGLHVPATLAGKGFF